MNAPVATYLNDYQPPAFWIDKTQLQFELFDDFSRVTSTLTLRRNESLKGKLPLVLTGLDLTLESISIDGVTLAKEQYQITGDSLTFSPPDECIVSCITTIKPHLNTLLEGLYRSSTMYCTQCEAEGFRRITYYLDRPDVMSEFTTTIIADKALYPVLLSNGNLIDSGDLKAEEGGTIRHWAKWHDPFKKPAYLFALVAGKLASINDTFTTTSGRDIQLVIYVEEKDLDKCDHAMVSLKKSMRWDEQVYGREYDLDLFMIVAVDDFNMGAMENKGLNIFNTSCVLANPATTTDSGFDRVESIVAHEYFHNWSGNRVTCRDWFQLSLKEGFTVFRDCQFSADMGSSTVQRVESVKVLRTAQFAEDSGPMSHPVQPDSYIEISNFYTLTIYEKGAEIVRMIHTLLGPELFRKGSDLYFQRYDGQAVTINEFVNSMASVSGRDFSQFMLWYKQAGTPKVTVTDKYDSENHTYQLNFKQETRSGDAFHIPVAIGLVGDNGDLTLESDSNIYSDGLIELTDKNQSVIFNNVSERPTPSLFRHFSAPVVIDYHYSQADYAKLIANDSDGFNRWNASHELAIEVINAIQAGQPVKEASGNLLEALAEVISDISLDKAMVALMLTLPSEAYLSQIAKVIDVEAIHTSRKALAVHIGEQLSDQLWALYHDNDNQGDYVFNASNVARRDIKNRALSYLILLNTERAKQACLEQYHRQHNMTDTLTALTLLVHSSDDNIEALKQQVLDDFYQRFQSETLVINLWLTVQATVPSVNTLDKVKMLLEHPSFDANNPNKIRAVIGGFCAQNRVGFHQEGGYQLLVEQVLKLNSTNPQIAARIITPLTGFRRYTPERARQMKTALESISKAPHLSKDLFEVVSKSLAE